MDRRWRLEEIGEETNGLEIEVVFGLGLAYKCVLKFKFYLGQKNGVGSITTHFVGFVSFFYLFIYFFCLDMGCSIKFNGLNQKKKGDLLGYGLGRARAVVQANSCLDPLLTNPMQSIG